MATCIIQSKERRIEPQSGLIHPSTRVSSYGLDSTNLDALCYKEVRGERKKNGSKVNSYCNCSKPSQAGEDRNKQGAGDCSKPRPVVNAWLQQA